MPISTIILEMFNTLISNPSDVIYAAHRSQAFLLKVFKEGGFNLESHAFMVFVWPLPEVDQQIQPWDRPR
jgi:hypothetical protein